MIPGKITEATRELGKPLNWDDSIGECDSLAVADMEINGGKVMVSMWHPSEQEIEAIKAGIPVFLWVFGTNHPPVALTVGEQI